MKQVEHLELSPLNSSGEGTLTYSTASGSVTLTYQDFGAYVTVPDAAEWTARFAGTWAEGAREAIVNGIIRLQVASWPDHKVEAWGLHFFDAKIEAAGKSAATQAALAVQSPSATAFLAELAQARAEGDDVAVFAFRVTEAENGRANAIITEVFSEHPSLAKQTLRIGYFQDVPVAPGREYLTWEVGSDILEYAGQPARWRYRRLLELTPELKKSL